MHRAFAKKLNDAPLAIVDKRRSAHNVSEVMNLIGDVDGKIAVLVDDMIDTAGTITNAAKVSTGCVLWDALCTYPDQISIYMPSTLSHNSLTTLPCGQVLHANGAREVYACCTHAVFSPPARERLSSGVFQEVIVTNTIPVAPDSQFPCLTVLSVANLLGETIWRVYNASSVLGLNS